MTLESLEYLWFYNAAPYFQNDQTQEKADDPENIPGSSQEKMNQVKSGI